MRGCVFLAGRVFQESTLASLIKGIETAAEGLVYGTLERLSVEAVDTDDTLLGDYHLACHRVFDLNLISLGIVDRRFAHRESKRNDMAGLALSGDVLADAEAVSRHSLDIDREHIAVLSRQDCLRLARPDGFQDRDEVVLD